MAGKKEVWRLDPDSLDVLDRIDVGRVPIDVGVGDGSVWVVVGG